MSEVDNLKVTVIPLSNSTVLSLIIIDTKYASNIYGRLHTHDRGLSFITYSFIDNFFQAQSAHWAITWGRWRTNRRTDRHMTTALFVLLLFYYHLW